MGPALNNLSSVCEQQRRRPACASKQFDQNLCYLLIFEDTVIIIGLATSKFQFLASL